MKKIIFFALAITLFTFLQTKAQNLSESLGCIKTNFQICSNSNDLKVSNQFLIKKLGVMFIRNWVPELYSHLAYESYHLEFVTDVEVSTIYLKKNDYFDQMAKVTFYDSNNNLLTYYYFYEETFKVNYINNSTYYSLDLRDIPIALLLNVNKIDIVNVKLNK